MATALLAVVIAASFIYLLPFLSRQNLAPWPIYLAMAMGTALCATVVVHMVRNLLAAHPSIWCLHEQVPSGCTSRQPIGCRVGAVLLGLTGLPLALFLGIVVGGKLGGWVGGLLGHGKVGVLVGIGAGLFGVTFLVGLLCTLAGCMAGGLAPWLLYKIRTRFFN